MRELKLVGLSADGRQVVFVDDTGAEFCCPADDRLRAALRGDRARLGQLEIEMESMLRPRDIQARIRAGDSPETVAALAQVTVEKIMPYCVPVLAERHHIAEVARRSHVRRKGAESVSMALADVIAERLRGRGVDPRLVDWDAWRRDDGRWAVQASYHSGEHERTALFVFDAVGRYSLPDDDEARWLTGEPQTTIKGPQPREGGRGGDRRLAAVPDGDDLLTISPTDDQGVDQGVQGDSATDDLTAVARAVHESDEDSAAADAEPGEDSDTDDTGTDTDEVGQGSEPASTSFLDQAFGRRAKPPAAGAAESTGVAAATTEPTPVRKRRQKRASVPSWDEIMFGKDDPEHPS
jgi:hypothetical protein